MIMPINNLWRRIRILILSLLIASPALAYAAPARAGGQETALIIFYGALKVSQSQAIMAAANYYDAVGFGAQAQKYNRLANDFSSGTLGGADSVKTFTQASAALQNDIYELQAYGAVPNAHQKELAEKADGQFAVAKVAMLAAVASGTAAALNCDCNTLEKIVIGVALAIQANTVVESLNRVMEAARAYRTLELGDSNGFQEVSKEGEALLASL
ncbi:MAG: hypothetical protein CGW95_01320 [Phenylobacterium zucineum]|nr:MAG: hypothetical protein CGW95_01320 [Phenylobacterium zucineum]